MMGVGSSAASMSLRNLARGEPSSPLHHKARAAAPLLCAAVAGCHLQGAARLKGSARFSRRCRLCSGPDSSIRTVAQHAIGSWAPSVWLMPARRLKLSNLCPGAWRPLECLVPASRGLTSGAALFQVTLHHQPRHKGDGPSDEGLVNNKAMNTNHCVGRIAKGPAWRIACPTMHSGSLKCCNIHVAQQQFLNVHEVLMQASL